MVRQIEPCMSCGDDTSVGTPLYSGRHQATDSNGRRVFLCASCNEEMIAGRRREPLTDEDRRKLEQAAAVFGAFAPGGH
jgi:hypothetical protein